MVIFWSIVVFILIVIILCVKNEITYINSNIIIRAIRTYRHDLINNHKFDELKTSVDYSDMEDSSRTFWRLWDWSYKRILPPEKFEIIKPFIKPYGKW